MNKIFIFCLLATCTVLLSVVVLAVGPITNKIVGQEWGKLNCQLLSDQVKLFKGDVTKLENMKNLCYRQKTMYDMEYAAFIINIVLSFICADLALLHYMDIGKDFEMKTGVIGLASGVIGFVLTLVYVCYSGYIFTNDVAYLELNIGHSSYNTFDYSIPSDPNPVIKLYENGAFVKYIEYKDPSDSKYEPIYEDDRDDFANYIRYKDLGKKEYNYDSKFYKNIYGYNGNNVEEIKCSYDSSDLTSNLPTDHKACPYAYDTFKVKKDNENKYLYDRWLTALILACVVLLTNLGLAVFGLLLFTNCGANADL